jgi:hypothetical protein
MPGWMIERIARLRLEGEAARHLKLILIERQHSSLSQNINFESALVGTRGEVCLGCS